jgi:hypothetical protein
VGKGLRATVGRRSSESSPGIPHEPFALNNPAHKNSRFVHFSIHSASIDTYCRRHCSSTPSHHVHVFPSGRLLPDDVRPSTFSALSRSFFADYSRSSLDEQRRKDAKSKNTNGSPIRLQSKILAVQADPLKDGFVYVAQSSGTVRRVNLEVSKCVSPVAKPLSTVANLSVLLLCLDGRNCCYFQRAHGACHESLL